MRNKKLVALIMTLVMVFAMSATALADETLSDGIVDSEHNTTTTADPSVLILKELVIYNTDGKAIYLPTVNYSYVITEAGEADGVGNTVTDSEGVSGLVYADDANTNGRALQTTEATVAFSPATTAGYNADGSEATITQPMVAAAAGTSVYGGFTITFDPSKFDHPGVYRYKITESSDNREAAGITTGSDTAAVRYLDVYVRTSGESYAIYGYVCFTDASAAIDPDTAAAAKKTNGFVHSGDDLSSVADQYLTKNLEVTKAFGTSALNQKGHQFPVTIVLTGTSATGAKLNAAATTGAKDTGFTDGNVIFDATTKTLIVNLSENQIAALYGIPAAVEPAATVQEENDTYDAYKLTVTAENSSVTSTGITNAIVVANSNSETSAVIKIDENEVTTITLTNDLTELSPTGLLFRFGPYILMLIGGIVLIVLGFKFARRSRRESEEA
ncbi:MAG: hypothetical protein IKI15_03085 [Lachnospiraceae bacterium]|nr:hypothetical protein [Lachnospiraceae bacterium]